MERWTWCVPWVQRTCDLLLMLLLMLPTPTCIQQRRLLLVAPWGYSQCRVTQTLAAIITVSCQWQQGQQWWASVQKWRISKARWIACLAYIFWAWFSSFMSILFCTQYSSTNLFFLFKLTLLSVKSDQEPWYIFLKKLYMYSNMQTCFHMYIYRNIYIFKEIIFQKKILVWIFKA